MFLFTTIIPQGSEDKTISISNVDGDTLKTITLRAEPSDMHFAELKLDERVTGENTVSAIVGKRTLYLYNLLDPENPFELAFQQHYGNIVTYKWYGDGYILIGFSAGYFISISTHVKEVGQELFQIRNHKNILTDIGVCEVISKAASCGDNSVKLHDLNNLQETSSVINLPQEAGLGRISWSPEGQLLAVCTRGGSVNVYVSHMQLLASICAPRIAILSSLTEIGLYNYTPDKSKLTPIFINLESEPSFIAVGQYHLAAGLNNRVWFYDLTKPDPDIEDMPLKLTDRQYLGGVSNVKLNPEYAAVLFEGKIQLHMIEQPQVCHEDRETITFPDAINDAVKITCYEMTTDFLIYGTDGGHIVHFHIEDWATANEFKHGVAVDQLYCDLAGSRSIVIDVKDNCHIHNAVTNELIPVPEPPDKFSGGAWDNDSSNRDLFIIWDDHEIHAYLYVSFSMDGATVKKLGRTSLMAKQIPLLLYNGDVVLATSSGQVSQMTLSTHEPSNSNGGEGDTVALEANFKKQLALHSFSLALATSKALKSRELMVQLAVESLKYLDIETAIKVYQELKDVSMVLSLEGLLEIDEWRLLCGYVAMYLNDYDKAQRWFLSSNRPTVALDMRRDLLQWDEALRLAKKMAPEQISMISREYAQQLEFLGNHSEALLHYEKGLQENLSEEHTYVCRAGIARTALHCANYRYGVGVAVELDNKHLLRECAEILDKKRQLAEAARLFEKCEQFDRAAANYIALKNWNKVGELLPHVTSAKIHLQYARAKEEEGRYDEAVKAYELAKDFDSVVRLHLERLDNAEIAVEIVQETKSVEGAKMVAKFFQNLNDTSSAIRFLVLSRCVEEAFELAKKNGKTELYGDILLNSFTDDEVKPRDFVPLAVHFENERNSLLAGKYWFHAREYHKALKYLLTAAKSGANEKRAIGAAIDVVASANDESLTATLIEFLLGESDGTPKDPKYLFRLYMARKQFKEASKSALIIANEEQINGNYRNAHDVLFAMCQELRQNSIKTPLEMYSNLMLLHSYILVRLHVRRGDHSKGARLLIRVADNISKFPSHVVPILTSTVIECHRAGLRHAAYRYATTLMNPDYRKQIDPKYAKKIEAVVRRPPKNGKEGGDTGDPVEPSTPCPFCEKSLPESDVTCGNCKSTLPFCIVTGRHITSENLTYCPNCDFPALRDEFIEILKTEESCPMCSEPVDQRRLVVVNDVKPYLNVE
ncbi:WD repeat-containing protein 19 isoform X2 [Cylas formicarius]|uniref:WD repeat-containing protein 19 isoform X2 n=1 Tax=Cylas formicarius TaxID=197179 RepID=UPI0029583880|nr:WD repeat-containing protein 19 isoform X2 [Cylas formicarius]